MPESLVTGFPKFEPTSFEEAVNPNDLQVIFNLQRMLMDACEIDLIPADIAFWVTGQALINEAGEALEGFADLTKPWKRNTVADVEALKGEVIDELFFVLQQMILLGMTSDDMVARYRAKSTINFQRIMEKMRQTEEMVA